MYILFILLLFFLFSSASVLTIPLSTHRCSHKISKVLTLSCLFVVPHYSHQLYHLSYIHMYMYIVLSHQCYNTFNGNSLDVRLESVNHCTLAREASEINHHHLLW